MKEPSTFDAPKFLIIATTLATFSFIVMIFYVNVPDAIANVLFTMIGIIIGKYGTIVEYFFGSSSGSKAKSDTINEMSGTGGGDGTGTSSTKEVKEVKETKEVKTTTVTAPPAWLTGTPYKVGDIVTVGTSKYRALADHTSAVTDEPGVGNDWSGIWERQA